MTSRRVSDSSGDQWRNFPLGVWRPEEAIAYLVQCTGLEAIETPELRKIAEEMGHLPLALKHAGSYLKQKKCRTAVDFSKYLKDFRTKGSKLKGFRFRGPNDNTVATTWRMTMDVTSDLCHQIMAYCSYLNPDKIPVDLLNSSEDDDITEAIETLDKYSMISYQGSEFISVHRLVQWVIRQQNRENQKEILENDLPEKILSYFEHSFKSDISDEKIQERSLNLVQHIVALIGHADNEGRPYADDHFLFGLGQVMNLTILISLVGEDKEREIEYRHELKKTRPLLFRGANIFFTLDFLEKIFEDCHPLIQFTLGIFYSLAQHDTEQAIKWWTKAGEKENISAQIILGEHYFWSKGVAQDYKQAVKWWTKAAEQEDASAQFNLGYVYAQGKGVVQDDVQAVTWLRQSANQGFVKAICLLGLAHTQGKGVTQDFEKAVMYFSLAAEKGFADGQYNLGVAYDWGKGVTQDYKQAVAWYRKAAEQRHAGAQRNLGNAYYYGNGVEQNDEQAVAWWKGAIERGDETALLNLLCCYFQGRGLEEDPTKHVEWCWKMWKERRLARIGTLGSWSCICL